MFSRLLFILCVKESSLTLIMEDVNIRSLVLYRCKQCFTRKGTRFARAVFGDNAQNNAVVCRQLWGQLFLQVNLRREDLNSIALQVVQVEMDEAYQDILGYFVDNRCGPFEIAMRHPMTSQQWKDLVLYMNINVIALRRYNLLS